VNKKTSYGERSSALILTLVFVTLLAILLVGFITSIGLELNSSTAHLNRVRADFYAQMGLDAAISQLTSTLSSTNLVATQPGQLVTNGSATPIRLYSGAAATNASTAQASDLNPQTFYNSGGYLIDPADAQPMRMAWVYVNQDGTYTNTAPPTFNAANPVVGRFAYWVDDQSAKINLNTAWTRGSQNTNNLSHPSQVELSGLFSDLLTSADANMVYTNGPYNSLQDVRRAGGNITNALNQQPFSFSHYSHSPDLNMFGQPRIMLTTQANLATNADGTTNQFLNILTTPNTDPGWAANLNPAGVNTNVMKIYSYLTNADWPINPGATFANKYAPGNNSRVAQLAVDIIDYVRSAESTNAFVEPIRGYWTSTGFQYGTVDPGTSSSTISAFLGNSRRPLITEIAVWVPASTVANQTIVCKVEVYLPPHYGFNSSIAANKLYLILYASPTITLSFYPGYNWYSSAAVGTANDTVTPSTVSSGGYMVVQRSSIPWYPTVPVSQPPTTRPSTLYLRVALCNNTATLGNGPVLDLACVPTIPGEGITYTVDPSTVSFANITSVTSSTNQVTGAPNTDPAINKRNIDWVQGPSSFGAANPTTLGTPAGSYSPQQDTDSSGNLTDTNMVFPNPKGTGSNPYGVVQSVGELGYIHSGIECIATNSSLGVPWRTLRLQPEKSSSTDLPDWALLDLFCVPQLNPNALTRPNSQSWGGRININSQIVPFTNDAGNPLLTRTAPLQSLLLNATNNTGTSVNSSQASTLASNIYYHVLSSANGNAGRTYGTGLMTNSYFSPGQIAEVAGISDAGESSEALVRSIVGLAATRGNVFSVYTIGQALKQDKSGNITVLSERRFQNIVERWDSGTNVTFRPVFEQTLTP